jgi:hypothetical protein
MISLFKAKIWMDEILEPPKSFSETVTHSLHYDSLYLPVLVCLQEVVKKMRIFYFGVTSTIVSENGLD